MLLTAIHDRNSHCATRLIQVNISLMNPGKLIFIVCLAIGLMHPWQLEARPNILIVIADDLNRDSLPCYGNKDALTPNVDRLASQGMRFSHAFTTTAMCAPTRAQLYTGLFPVRSGAYPNHSRVKDGTTSIVHDLQKLGYRVGLNGKEHFKPKSAFPFQKVGGGKFNAEAIGKFISQKNNQPFCLVMASHSPHVPWKSGDASKFDPDSLTIPEYWIDSPEMRQAMTRYYGELNDLDRELGVCMDFVEKAGKSENTVVIFTTEQGAQMPGCKWTCYETGLNLGLIIKWPGVAKANSLSDAWVHHIDIRPTLVEIAGGAPDQLLDGKSFAAVLKGETDSHRQVTYGVHTQMGAIGAPKSGYPVRSIRKGPYKLILNLNHSVPYSNALTKNDNESYWASWVSSAEKDEHSAFLVKRYIQRPPVEFYNLALDPYELDNVADNALYLWHIESLRMELHDWMTSQGDLGVETELDAPSRK